MPWGLSLLNTGGLTPHVVVQPAPQGLQSGQSPHLTPPPLQTVTSTKPAGQCPLFLPAVNAVRAPASNGAPASSGALFAGCGVSMPLASAEFASTATVEGAGMAGTFDASTAGEDCAFTDTEAAGSGAGLPASPRVHPKAPRQTLATTDPVKRTAFMEAHSIDKENSRHA